MSYKVYNYSLEFIDCPYNDGLKTKIADLVKSIDTGRVPFVAEYEFEVSKNYDGSLTTSSNSNGLTDDQKRMLEGIILVAQEAAKSGGGKSKIKNEVKVDKEA